MLALSHRGRGAKNDIASRTYELELQHGKVKVVGYSTTLIGIEHKPVRHRQNALLRNCFGVASEARDQPKHACS